jgi:hypothetical protein
MRTLIIQTSPPGTTSTVLINALYGMIPELTNKKIIGDWLDNFNLLFDDLIAVKSHNINIDELIERYQDIHKLYFICSERPEKNYYMDPKYKSYENVRIFSFNELNESETNSVRNIVENIHNKIKDMLNIEMNIETGIKRIEDMNKVYQEIKDKPFNYTDDFYELHGSHRNRK